MNKLKEQNKTEKSFLIILVITLHWQVIDVFYTIGLCGQSNLELIPTPLPRSICMWSVCVCVFVRAPQEGIVYSLSEWNQRNVYVTGSIHKKANAFPINNLHDRGSIDVFWWFTYYEL